MENWHLFEQLGFPDYLNGTWYLSLMTVGVAFIAGRGGVAFIIGGFVCYWFLAPLLDITGMFPVNQAGEVISDPNQLRLMLFRPTGIGMLIGGAIIGVVFAFPLIKSAVKSMQSSAKTESAMSKDEMPIKLLYVAVVGAAIFTGRYGHNFCRGSGHTTPGVTMALLGNLMDLDGWNYTF